MTQEIDESEEEAYVKNIRLKKRQELEEEEKQRAIAASPATSLNTQAATKIPLAACIALVEERFGDTWIDLSILKFEDVFVCELLSRINAALTVGVVYPGACCLSDVFRAFD